MNVCFLLHLYQPSNQFAEVVKKVASECYVPLIKSIKNNRKLRITLNINLSLLEQLERLGFAWLIRDIKDLVDTGRVELTGSGAYHPLFTKIPVEFISKQVILNEMGLGYYFGSRKDFEGEDCLMVRNLKGFFPPEMAVNREVLQELCTLGYEWVAVDEYCLPNTEREHRKSNIYTISSDLPKLVVRNRRLSTLISFQRDLDRTAILQEMSKDELDKFVALDAETFGHHYKDGIYLFESLLGDIQSKGWTLSTVSDSCVDMDPVQISEINESTWSSNESSIYPLWVSEDSEINTALWALLQEVHVAFTQKFPAVTLEEQGCAPVWKKDAQVSTRAALELNLLKLEQSDQFWWTTGVEIMGKKNFSRYMAESVLDYYSAATAALESPALLERVEQIKGLLSFV